MRQIQPASSSTAAAHGACSILCCFYACMLLHPHSSTLPFAACLPACSHGRLGKPRPPTWGVPQTGIYRSTALLQAVQQHMRPTNTTTTSTSNPTTSTRISSTSISSHSYTAPPLVAYMSASDVLQGQGWKARATLFVALLAPRYTLLPLAHPSLKPQLRLLRLAAADLPAVGRLAGSEVRRARPALPLLGC